MNVSSGGQLWDFSSSWSTGLAPSFQAVKISMGGQLESPNPSETGTVESFVRFVVKSNLLFSLYFVKANLFYPNSSIAKLYNSCS